MAKDFTKNVWTLDLRDKIYDDDENDGVEFPLPLSVEARDMDGNIMEIPDDKMIVRTPYGDYLIDAPSEKGEFYYEGKKLGEKNDD